MSITLAVGRPTLADRLFARSLVTDLVLIAAGTALTAAMAQLVIPMWPVPITGQTFAVLLTGATLGAVRAAISMALYLVLGVVGLPIFADHGSGGIIGSPSGGYLLGFIVAAALVGWLAQREWDRKVLGTFLAFAAGTVVIYAFGLPWLYVVLAGLGVPDTFSATIDGGLVPFLIGDTIKALLAAGLLPLTWWAVRRADAKKAERSAE